MAYSTREAREELLEGLERAIDELGVALAALGEAYEGLDEHAAGRLEEGLFGPVQRAYGQARRTHAAFAGRHGLSGPDPAPAVAPAGRPGEQIAAATESAARADATLSDVQDSPTFAEVGDVDLRAGITSVRQLLAEVPRQARELARTLGR